MTIALAFGLLKVGRSSPFFEAFLPKGSLLGGAWEPQPNKGNSSDSGKRKSCLRATKRGTPFVDGQNPTSGRWFITVLIGLCFSTCFPTRTKEGDANKNGVFLLGFPSRPIQGILKQSRAQILETRRFFLLLPFTTATSARAKIEYEATFEPATATKPPRQMRWPPLCGCPAGLSQVERHRRVLPFGHGLAFFFSEGAPVLVLEGNQKEDLIPFWGVPFQKERRALLFHGRWASLFGFLAGGASEN